MRKILTVSLLASALLLVGFGGGASAEARAGISGLSGLKHKVAALTAEVNALQSFQSCLRTIPMTRYYGYWYGSNGYYTTGLDISSIGGAIQYYVVRDTCGAVPLGRASKPVRRDAVGRR